MKDESSTGGFEQASAEAEKLAAELAAIRKQLTELREQNATFLATDPVTGQAAPGAAEPSGAKAGPPAKEPQMAGADKKGASKKTAAATGAGAAATTATTKPEQTPAEGKETSGTDEDQSRRKWWRKPKTSDAKQSGF